jgi:hypothetical protein
MLTRKKKMREIDLYESGVDADPKRRSPCFKCPRVNKSKKLKICETCEDRIAYVKSLGGPTTVDEITGLMSGESLPPDNLKRPRLCDCGEIHYAKGKCVTCYYKEYWAKIGKKTPKGTTMTIRFQSVDGGKEFLNLIRHIAKYEHRSINEQVIVFLALGVKEWLDEHEDME